MNIFNLFRKKKPKEEPKPRKPFYPNNANRYRDNPYPQLSDSGSSDCGSSCD